MRAADHPGRAALHHHPSERDAGIDQIFAALDGGGSHGVRDLGGRLVHNQRDLVFTGEKPLRDRHDRLIDVHPRGRDGRNHRQPAVIVDRDARVDRVTVDLVCEPRDEGVQWASGRRLGLTLRDRRPATAADCRVECARRCRRTRGSAGHRPQRPLPEDSAPTTRRLRSPDHPGSPSGRDRWRKSRSGRQAESRSLRSRDGCRSHPGRSQDVHSGRRPAGIERGFDDVRGDGRDAAVRGIGIEVDRRCYRYAVHQRPRPGARLVPERSLTTPIHGGRDRRRAIKASTGFGRSDLECLVSRGKRERSAGIFREVGIETGASIGRGETAEIQTGDVDSGRCDPGGMRRRAPNPRLPPQQRGQPPATPGSQACDLLRRRR